MSWGWDRFSWLSIKLLPVDIMFEWKKWLLVTWVVVCVMVCVIGSILLAAPMLGQLSTEIEEIVSLMGKVLAKIERWADQP